jgi:nucleotide-binding universal stress UspA family protein
MALSRRLEQLNRPAEIRRIDLYASDVGRVAAREARSADAFVALRPNGARVALESNDLIEGVLFGSGRHLFLASQLNLPDGGFEHALIAWNGSREAARAMAEALPYLHNSHAVTVVVVSGAPPIELDAVLGAEAVSYLRRQGIEAGLHRMTKRGGNIGSILLNEVARLNADLFVMGGYGHSRVREWLLGGVTHHFLTHASVPLLIAH